MSKKKTFLLIGLVIIIGVFFRFYNIQTLPPGLYPDEAMNGNNALEALDTGEFKIFYPENNGREGFFINLQALALKFTGIREPWVLRSMSGIFGILTVLGIYLLGMAIFKERAKIALFASFFSAVAFWHVNFSRIGFRAIMAPFFFTWALFLLVKALRSESGRRWTYAFIGGLFLGGGFHSYIAYRITPLIAFMVFLFFIKERGLKNIIKIGIVFFVGALITASPLLLYFTDNPQDFFGRTSQISIFSGENPLKDLALNTVKTLLMFNGAGDYNWRHHIAGAPLLSFPLGIFFIIGVVYGLIALFRKNQLDDFDIRRASAILFSWFLVALLPIVVSNEGIPHSLRAILLVPPIMIFTGLGAYLFLKLITSKFKERISNIFVSATVIIVLIVSYHDYFVRWGKNPEIQGAFSANYVEIGKEINSLPLETTKYVLVEAGGTDVRGLPMPTQTTMFVTDSFTPEKQKAKNIIYITKDLVSGIPPNARVFFLR